MAVSTYTSHSPVSVPLSLCVCLPTSPRCSLSCRVGETQSRCSKPPAPVERGASDGQTPESESSTRGCGQLCPLLPIEMTHKAQESNRCLFHIYVTHLELKLCDGSQGLSSHLPRCLLPSSAICEQLAFPAPAQCVWVCWTLGCGRGITPSQPGTCGAVNFPASRISS